MKLKIRTKLLLGLAILLIWIVLLTLHALADIDELSGQPISSDMILSALIMVFFFLISAALGLRFWRSINHSLRRLTEGAEKFGQGNLGHRIRIESGDELGLLAETLNGMAANLSLARQELLLPSKITESMHEGIHLARINDGSVVYTNPRFDEMFGYSPGELNGQHISIINAPTEDSPEETDAKIVSAVKERGFWRGEVHNTRKDGSLFWCESSISTFDHPEHGAVFISVHTDITERKLAEDLQEAIYRIVQAADQAETLDSLYPAIHDIIQEVMVADNFYIALYDEHNDLLSFPYCIDEMDPPYAPHKPGKGLTEFVLRTGKSLLCDDILFAELIQRDAVELVGVNSPIWLGAPLIAADKVIGVMVVQDYENARAYGIREQRILEFVSSQVAMAIHRKQSEEALRESEARYRAVVEDQSVMIYRFDLDHTITFANRAYCEFHSTPMEEIIGRNLLELIEEFDPASLAMARENIAMLTPENPTFKQEHEAINTKGEKFWILWTDRLLFDEDGNPSEYQTIGLDITERRQTEEALRESEERFRILSAATFEGVGFSEKGVIVDANQQLADILGYDLDELIGLQVDKFVAPQDMAFVRQMIAAGVETPYEHRSVRKDGSIIFTEVRPRMMPVQGAGMRVTAIRDITERKQAEEALRESEKALEEQHSFLRQVIDSIPNGILVKDRAGRYILANQTLAEALGATPDELVGKRETDVYYNKEDAARFIQEDLEVMDSLQEKFILEQENFHAGGEYHWVQVTKRPLIGLDGKADRVLTVVVNITERKQLEEAMVESQKLAALGTLAAGIAHEINSPLQVITGTSESLQRRLDQDKLALHELPNSLAMINRNAWRVAGIVRSLLTYARPSSGELDSHDLNALVKDTLLLIEHQLKTWSNITVTTELAPDMPGLTCDSEKISQMLINFLNNAAMPCRMAATYRSAQSMKTSPGSSPWKFQTPARESPKKFAPGSLIPFLQPSPLVKAAGWAFLSSVGSSRLMAARSRWTALWAQVRLSPSPCRSSRRPLLRLTRGDATAISVKRN